MRVLRLCIHGMGPQPLQVEGDKTPVFDDSGAVVHTDSTGTLISDMKKSLQLRYHVLGAFS